MRGYEIEIIFEGTNNIGGFRIPMRGYEADGDYAAHTRGLVPNPHEGL